MISVPLDLSGMETVGAPSGTPTAVVRSSDGGQAIDDFQVVKIDAPTGTSKRYVVSATGGLPGRAYTITLRVPYALGENTVAQYVELARFQQGDYGEEGRATILVVGGDNVLAANNSALEGAIPDGTDFRVRRIGGGMADV